MNPWEHMVRELLRRVDSRIRKAVRLVRADPEAPAPSGDGWVLSVGRQRVALSGGAGWLSGVEVVNMPQTGNSATPVLFPVPLDAPPRVFLQIASGATGVAGARVIPVDVDEEGFELRAWGAGTALTGVPVSWLAVATA